MNLLDKCRTYTTARDAIAAGYYPYFVPFDNGDAPPPFLAAGRS